MSSAPSAPSCSRRDGLVADLIIAIASLAASIGPPGSASAIASPATNGARTIRVHSSSEKSFLVVMACPFVRSPWVGVRAPAEVAPRRSVSTVAPSLATDPAAPPCCCDSGGGPPPPPGPQGRADPRPGPSGPALLLRQRRGRPLVRRRAGYGVGLAEVDVDETRLAVRVER